MAARRQSSPSPSSSTGSTSSLTSSASPRTIKSKLPITSIPDMRFEQSYLASVRGFVHEYQPGPADELKKESKADKEKSDGSKEEKVSDIVSARSSTGEPELWLGRLRIQWWPLLHLTIRDQILSPIIQGAFFGIGGLALTQIRAYLVARREMPPSERR